MTTIKIDYDLQHRYARVTPETINIVFDKLLLLRRWVRVVSSFFTITIINVYITARGLHVVIKIRERLSDIELALLQSTIDDRVRALFNSLRLMGRAPGYFNLLFSTKLWITPSGVRVVGTERRCRVLEKWLWGVVYGKEKSKE